LTQNATRQERRIDNFDGRFLVDQVFTQYPDGVADLGARITSDSLQIGVTATEGIDEIRPGTVKQVPVIWQPYLTYAYLLRAK
jgi:hypothetical protein